jgi:hypothetical protein
VALSLVKDGFAPVRVKAPGNRRCVWRSRALRLTAERSAETAGAHRRKLRYRGRVTPVVEGGRRPIGKEVKVSRAGSAGSSPRPRSPKR